MTPARRAAWERTRERAVALAPELTPLGAATAWERHAAVLDAAAVVLDADTGDGHVAVSLADAPIKRDLPGRLARLTLAGTVAPALLTAACDAARALGASHALTACDAADAAGPGWAAAGFGPYFSDFVGAPWRPPVAPAGAPAVQRAATIDDRDVLPLWTALIEHHASVEPAQLPPASDPARSWARRAPADREALAAGSCALLLTRDEAGAATAMALYARAGTDAVFTSADRAELDLLAVLPDGRGAGTGTALLAAAAPVLRDWDATALQLSVIAGNGDAVRFYRRHGLRPWRSTLLAPLGP